MENTDSLASPAVAGKGASKKQSSQLSIGSQGPSGRLERFTRVGNLGEPFNSEKIFDNFH